MQQQLKMIYLNIYPPVNIRYYNPPASVLQVSILHTFICLCLFMSQWQMATGLWVFHVNDEVWSYDRTNLYQQLLNK